jgi:hypothetical protein
MKNIISVGVGETYSVPHLHGVGKVSCIYPKTGMADVYVTNSTGGFFTCVSIGDLYEVPKEKKESETTAKPSRYSQGSLEVWDGITQLGFDYMQGAVVKYISRYKHKNGAQDLKKAINYLVKMLAEETKQDYYELRKKSVDEVTGD